LDASNNSSTAQVGATSPSFVSGTPSVPANFALNAGSYAINFGASVPVFSDYFRNSRPQGGGFDLGAAEQ